MIYRVNRQDELTFVDEDWGRFAAENSGDADLAPARVLGRSVWELIGDTTVRQLYRAMMARVRGGRTIRFNFRCDSADCGRLLEMTIVPLADGAVEFQTRTVRAEPRPTGAPPPSKPGEPASGDFLCVCGWCARIEVEGRWEEPERAVDRLRLFEPETLPQLTHGICGDCLRRMRATLDVGGA